MARLRPLCRCERIASVKEGARAVMRWLGLVVVGLLLVGVVGLGSGVAQPRMGVIRITAQEITSYRMEYGPRRAGHVEIVWAALFNRRLTQRAIGHVQSVCIRLARVAWNCKESYFLPRGKLVVSGATGLARVYEQPVTGGTGFYAGARGVLRVQITAVWPRTETLTFRLVMQP